MSSFLVDTNILIYAANAEVPENKSAIKLLEAAGRSALIWHISWQNVYEFLSVVTNPKAFQGRVLTLPEARQFIDTLLTAPNQRFIQESEDHLQVFDDITGSLPGSYGPFLHDCHLATLVKEYGVKRVYSADSGFRRFSFLEIINPFETENWKL